VLQHQIFQIPNPITCQNKTKQKQTNKQTKHNNENKNKNKKKQDLNDVMQNKANRVIA